MTIFNSLGSNYTAGMAFKSLAPASPTAPKHLRKYLKESYGAEEVVLTNRCRQAIVLILRGLGLPANSYVAITGYTCYVVYEAVVAAGLKPYFVDITKDDLNFTAKDLEAAFKAEPRIKAVLVQNTMGLPADIVGIKKVADAHNIPVVEDLAHGAGLTYEDGSLAGTVGVAAALSFSQNKIIDASAGGAAICKQPLIGKTKLKRVGLWERFTNNLYPLTTLIIRKTHRFIFGKVLLKAVKALHILPDPAAGYAGDVYALPAHQARLTHQYLQGFDQVTAHRRKIAALYSKALPEAVQFKTGKGAVYVRYPIKVEDQHGLEKFLKTFGINLGTSWYETVIAPRRFLKKATLYKPGQCPNGEWMAEHIINLPTHVNVSEAKARFIAEKVNQWLQSQ